MNSYFCNITKSGNGTFTSTAWIPVATAGLHALCKPVELRTHPHYWMLAETDTFRLKCGAWWMSETENGHCLGFIHQLWKINPFHLLEIKYEKLQNIRYKLSEPKATKSPTEPNNIKLTIPPKPTTWHSPETPPHTFNHHDLHVYNWY